MWWMSFGRDLDVVDALWMLSGCGECFSDAIWMWRMHIGRDLDAVDAVWMNSGGGRT